MTLIKSMTAHGFKSFAKKTEIPFGEKFNCILGPNGSGKSNIVDALCFVLGKSSAKGMRAEKSSHLIYNGGKKGSPSKEAEVSIVFDNSNKIFPLKEKEITITRVVKPNGNSVYRIMDDVVTRQQVLDILSHARIDPDGHNIVLQGDIIRFMEMRPEQRREIIEEVSGIGVYEEKKQKSLLELNRVEEKLNEAKIILHEKEINLRELKKDRDQALKYKELEGNIQRNKATYLHMQIKEKEEKKEDIDKKLKSNQDEMESIRKKILELKTEVESKKQEIENINKHIEEKGEIEQKRLHSDIEDLKISLTKDRSRKEVCESEVTKINNRKTQLVKNIKDIEEKIDELRKNKISLEKQKNLLKTDEEKVKKELAQVKSKLTGVGNLEEVEKNFDRVLVDIELLKDRQQQLLRKKDNIDYQKTMLNADESKESLINILDLKKSFKQITIDLTKELNESSKINSQLAKARENLVNSNNDLARLNARQITQCAFSQQSLAIKNILDLKKKGVHGVVSDLGEVDPKYNQALSVAAGPRLNSIVVDDDKIAQECIEHLKKIKAGVVTFFPLNKIQGNQITNTHKQFVNNNGVVGFAIDLVKFNQKYKDIFSYTFGSTLVVDNLNNARKIGVGEIRMVTLEGDLVESSGAMVGGYRKPSGAFKERDLSNDITKIEETINRLKETVTLLDQKRVENENKIYELKNTKSGLEADIIKLEKLTGGKDLDEIGQKQKQIIQDFNLTIKEIAEIEGKIKIKSQELEKLKEQKTIIIEKTKNLKETEQINELESKKEEITSKILKINADIEGFDVQIKDIYLREKEKIQKIIIDSGKELESFKTEIEELNKKLSDGAGALKEKEKTEKEFYNTFRNLFNKRNMIDQVINKKEGFLLREEEKIKGIEFRINNINIDRAKIVAELESINQEFVQYTDISLRKGVEIEELKFEIKKFEGLMSQLGNINMRALEVYDKVNEEYEKIMEKAEVLKSEKEDIFTLMQEIEGKKKSLFMKTYKALAENFKRIFASLSTKGEAHLEIEDEENIFESGVQIKVKLAGNKFMDLKSLSGGEKTLTALSFIFAIQEYSPASFYLLDEVDAALDKRNSTLLSKLIAKYAGNAQYIVVSHNDSIITEADRLYGVSMQEGVTKIVSLKV
ncbi:MAG: chromosome segregation protein SMC [Candidatus Nanoarchaeia archaeon]|nr:chromosome segregation protein SMC [Candidatus Nanoarchaeia archaeon]